MHLSRDQCKRLLLGALNHELERHHAVCIGFVIMPDHVHSLIWFHETGQLSSFIRDWKRSSSRSFKLYLLEQSEKLKILVSYIIIIQTLEHFIKDFKKSHKVS